MYTSLTTLPFQNYRLLYVPPGLMYTLPTYSVCVLNVSLPINSDYSPLQYSPTDRFDVRKLFFQ